MHLKINDKSSRKHRHWYVIISYLLANADLCHCHVLFSVQVGQCLFTLKNPQDFEFYTVPLSRN